MENQQYLDVTEFIQSAADLRSDGTYFYHDSLFAYGYPHGGNYQFKFYGNASDFNISNPQQVEDGLVTASSPLRKTGMCGRTLIVLDQNNKINFYHFNVVDGSLENDTSYISTNFQSVLDATGVQDFDIQQSGGVDDATAGAIFATSEGELIFHNVPFPSNIDVLTSGKFPTHVALDNQKHFCIRFSDNSILYYNGAEFNDVSYELVPTDVITTQNYEIEGFEDTPKESPNQLNNIVAVTANDGFNVLTVDGRVVVWGGLLQPINDNDIDYIVPAIKNNVVKLYTGGLDYSVALTEEGYILTWGKNTDDMLLNANLITDEIQDVICFDMDFLYTINDGIDLLHSFDTVPHDPMLASLIAAYGWDKLTEDNEFLKLSAYRPTYAINYIEHVNQSFDPVRMNFKMKRQDGRYYIPLYEYFPFLLAGIRLEVFNTIRTGGTSLGRNVKFSIEDIFTSTDGNVDRSKVVVKPIDLNNNGIPDDPFAYKSLVNDSDYIILESFMDNNNTQASRISRDVRMLSDVAFLAEDAVYYADITRDFTDIDNVSHTYEKGIFYRGEKNVNNMVVNRGIELPMGYDDVNNKRYILRNGKGYSATEPFMFQWNHFSTDGGDIIDPSISNLMDMYILTTSYDEDVRRWLRNNGDPDAMPQPPTSEELRTMIRFIEKNKSTSDQIIYIPARYKLLFGESARPEHQAVFNVVKTLGSTLSDNEIKSRIINATNSYFDLDNWDFGEKFYFSELAGYIHQDLAGEISSIVIVPRFRDASFGDLYQIQSEPNELFLSTASVDDVVINSHYTSQNMRRGGGN